MIEMADKKLQEVVERLNKKYGANAVMLGVTKQEVESKIPAQFISTGLLQLDVDLGGGIAVGRYT